MSELNDLVRRRAKIVMVGLAGLGMITPAFAAKSACDGVKVEVTKARKQEYAPPSEKPELASWAKKLGAPQDLAKCFAETVTE